MLESEPPHQGQRLAFALCRSLAVDRLDRTLNDVGMAGFRGAPADQADILLPRQRRQPTHLNTRRATRIE